MNYISEVKGLIKNKKACVRTFGCQLNENDSEKYAGLLEEMGYTLTEAQEEADLVLVNTCAIRENAEKKTFGLLGVLKHLKELRPSLIVVFAGCMAGEEHVVKKLTETYRHVDIMLGANNKEELPRLLFTFLTENRRVFDTSFDEKRVVEGLPSKRPWRYRAGVPVMYGCNNFCTYCIVPYVRGRERSREEADIVREVEALYADGCREIMLLGQNVNSYGGGGDAFAHLLEKVSDTGIPRIRFMTSHPKDISESLICVMAERENICKCLHLPVQSGNNRVLEKMNRRYTREKYLETVSMVRGKMPDIALTTDIIVGFPGETNEEFADTLSLLAEVRFDSIFSFIYSPRRGTPASVMPNILTEEEKKENFEKMLALQSKISFEKNKLLEKKRVTVLCEGESKTDETRLTGRTEGGKIVNFIGEGVSAGDFAEVLITEAKTWNLQGDLICRLD